MSDWMVIQVEAPSDEPGGPNQTVSGAKVCLLPRVEVEDNHWPFEGLSATHAEAEAGVYRAEPPSQTEGEFFLVVSVEERSTVAQRLRIKFSEPHGTLIAIPGWELIPKKREKEPGYDPGPESGTEAERTAAAVSLPRYKHVRGLHDNPNRAPLKVLMFPATELVFMATADYRNVHSANTKKKPLDYRLFANGRRNRLYARRNREESIYKKPASSEPNFDAAAYEARTNGMNPGTVYSLFWCHDRTKTTMLKSQAGGSSQWIVVDTFERQPIPDLEEERQYFNNPKRAALNGPATDPDSDSRLETFEWSALDVYKYVDAVAVRSPNSILEMGFFGHGWIAGPLVWSTMDAVDSFTKRWKGGQVTDIVGNTALVRADVNGRQKDWFRDAREDYPNILDAFHEKASFRCWGCNHMTITLSEGRAGFDKLEAGLADDEMFRFPTKVEFTNSNGDTFPVPLGRESASIRHLAKNLEFYFKSVRNERCIEQGDARGVVAYCGAAAGFLGIPTFGAPPGSGSSYSNNRNMVVEAFTAEKCIKFMKARYGKAYQESDEGYVDYRLVFDALEELPDPGWSTERWIRFFAAGRGELIEVTDGFVAPYVLRVASGLEVFRRAANFGIGSTSSVFEKEDAMALAFPDPQPFVHDGEKGHLFRTPHSKPERFERRIHIGEEDWERRALICVGNQAQDTGVFVTESGKVLLFKAPPGTNDWIPDQIGIQDSNWTGVVRFWKAEPDVGEPSHVLEDVEAKFYW